LEGYVTLSERVIQRVIELGGAITRLQCQQIARELGVRNINSMFGTQRPSMVRLVPNPRTRHLNDDLRRLT
jgi:hypothetical protein